MGVSEMSNIGPVGRLQHQQMILSGSGSKDKQKDKDKEQPTRCHCAVDDLLAPIKSKMKVLKKFKKRMGLAPRSAINNSTNNLPPILFHQVHGDNISLLNGGKVAKRSESFCKGVTFSNRPIKVGEKVCIKFLEISNNWSGLIRFGFTNYDPTTLRQGLPRYACPDLTNKPGYWAKALSERFAEQDTVLFYYVTQTGDVHFGINGDDKGFFFSGVDTRGPLWALIDVYGNSTAIEMVDMRAQLNNSRRSLSGGDSSPEQVHRLIAPMSSLSVHSVYSPATPAAAHSPSPSPSPVVPAPAQAPEDALPAPRFQPSGAVFSPLQFHRMRGRNIRLNNDRTLASRADTEFCHGYVFTQRPVMLGERIVVQVLNTEPAYVGALAFGLTSCDPSMLQSSDLPDDADLLLDRSEYWVVSKDVASCPQRGDELTFCITHKGEVTISRNGGAPVTFMHVDQSLQLWAFLDVYGSTQRVRLLGVLGSGSGSSSSCSSSSMVDRNSTPPPRALRVSLPVSHHAAIDPHTANNQNNGRVSVYCPPVPPHGHIHPHPHHHPHPQHHPQHHASAVPSVPAPTQAPLATSTVSPTAEVLQLQQGGGTVLVVNLPPNPHTYHPGPPPGPQPRHSPPLAASQQVVELPPTTSGTLMSTYSDSAYIEPVSRTSYSTMESVQQWADGRATNTTTGSECSICYERTIDSVLYMCGHMCMCYECAVQQWRGKGGGHCPLCRAVIRDVIRTYKS